VSVRHLDQQNALARITVIAKQAINPGEELVITYVNPTMGVRKRQDKLREWGFGKCKCKRCIQEEVMIGKGGYVGGGEEAGESVDDLARELKAGLGVM